MIATFGEALLRLSPPDFHRIEQTPRFEIEVGGAELNVAVGAARLGIPARWISVLPQSPLGSLVRNRCRAQGVEASHIVFKPDTRLGLYFFERGAPPRPSRVHYDRANSAMSQLKLGDIDWTHALEGCRYFHVSGITPALSDDCAKVTAEALQAAKAQGLETSYDLNYRATLWSFERAREVQTSFLEHIDLLVSSGEVLERFFGWEAGLKVSEIAERILERYPVKTLLIPKKVGQAQGGNVLKVHLFTREEHLKSREFVISDVEPVGGGDSFIAGFLASRAKGAKLGEALDYGAAFAALKYSIPGDFNFADADDVEAVLGGETLTLKR